MLTVLNTSCAKLCFGIVDSPEKFRHSKLQTVHNEVLKCLFQILSEIMKQDSVSEEDLTTMLRPVVACLTRKTTMCSLISTPLTVSILRSLNLLVANKNVAKVRERLSLSRC